VRVYSIDYKGTDSSGDGYKHISARSLPEAIRLSRNHLPAWELKEVKIRLVGELANHPDEDLPEGDT
jgi:hypothetical protein